MSLKFDEDKRPFVDVGNNFIVRLETDELTDECKAKARHELREEPDIVAQALKDYRALLEQDKNLHIPTDDKNLLKSLRPCKFYADSAYKRIQNYYRFKIKHKAECEDLYPSSVRHAFEQELVRLQPRRDQNGCRILVVESGRKWKPSKCSLTDLFRTMQLCLEAATEEPLTQVNGVVVIFDMNDLPLSHVMQFTPSFAMMLLNWVQECIPMRIKGIHIVNNSKIFNMVFMIFKPFIGEKLRKRIYLHNKDWKSLHEHVTPDSLRSCYGGNMDCPEVKGSLLGDMMQCYSKDYEIANTYGYIAEK